MRPPVALAATVKVPGLSAATTSVVDAQPAKLAQAAIAASDTSDAKTPRIRPNRARPATPVLSGSPRLFE
jgi:hypothetical protein